MLIVQFKLQHFYFKTSYSIPPAISPLKWDQQTQTKRIAKLLDEYYVKGLVPQLSLNLHQYISSTLPYTLQCHV